ncbi:MAG: trypsin-like serine protease [Planctomycetes bacterium]|nr:trypsin-like serine protease [Planctomycetota bacterium]
MYRYAECPVCHSKLKYRGERSSIVCPGCQSQFAIASEQPLPTLQPTSLALSGSLPSDNQSNEQPKISSSSRGIAIGIAVGAATTIAIVCAVMLVPDSDALSPTNSEHAKESSVAVAVESVSTPVVKPAEQPTTELSQSEEKEHPRESSDSPQRSDVELSSVVEKKRRPSEPQQPDSQELGEEKADLDQPTTAKTSLLYQWDTGRSHNYSFQLVVDLKEGQKTVKGNCTYSVGKVVNKPTEEELTGTGTGFFVSQDGYLVTCAHVVQDAARVKVVLGEREWEGKVVAVDQVQDLAIVHVEASGLPTLMLSDASGVELAEPVRVVGFPLSDMLGKGIKMTSGTVAGRTQEEEGGGRTFQIDATVNPGNSGGPIVDDQGRVVGVASALLSGIRISEVGFGVPADEVLRLLKRSKITPNAKARPKPQSGPELARMVTPAVAYLEVVLNPESRQAYRVDFKYNFLTQTTPPKKASTASALRVLDSNTASLFPVTGRVNFSVTRFGQMSQYKGKGSLPYDLGPIGGLVIEDMSHEGKKSWSSSSLKEFSIKEERNRFQFPRHFGHQNSSQLQALLEPETKTYPAIERNSYKVTEESSDLVTITKNYEFRTLEEDDPPLFQQKGTGTLVFNKKIGMPVSLEYESKVSFRSKDGSVDTVPYTLSYKLLNPEEAAEEQVLNLAVVAARLMGASLAKDTERKFRRKPKGNGTRRSADAKPKRDPERVDELIAILMPDTSNNQDRRGQLRRHHGPAHLQELRELTELPVVPKRQQLVGKIFLYYANKPNAFDQRAAVEGLANWATKKQVPGMIKLLTEDAEGIDWPERKEIIKALGRFKSLRVARAVASRLVYFTEDSEAKEVLLAFGADTEEAVSEMLDHKSEDAREAAAEILKKIGTRKSLSALKKALDEEPEHFAKRSIQDAIDAILRR